ncbi:hypothetical protein [Mesorhizobium sp. B2-8-3]|uniref:hypothetical protein n=1 Tax=Mesorhizobium sp. B2-8-3 TaxID=2589905 RepID=UPI001129AC7C|nr:hypothetical protein [Mesorhizobium sp. B2-8-3]TPJ28671.1 hypothetical protein FJ418_26555 [Mesorhizobium sp. B2-8-3]
MSRALSLALLLALSAPAFGQTVDSQGAKQLSDNLARYIGRAAIDEGILKVSVDGDAYRIGFDFGALLKKNHSNDPLTFNLEPFALLVRPRSDGTWSLSSDITPDAFLDVGGPGGARLSVSGATFSAVYDPALVAFTSGASSIADTKLVSRDPKDPVDLSIGAFTSSLNASKAAAGGIDFTMNQTAADFVEHFTYDADEIGVKVPGTLSSPKVSAEISGKGVHSKALLELLDFALANRDDASLKIKQGELKKLLTNALPLWDRLEESYRFHGFTGESPVGKFTVADLSARTGIDGISKNGKVDYTIKMAGLTLPERSLPSWSVALLPTDAELQSAASTSTSTASQGKQSRPLILPRIHLCPMNLAKPWPPISWPRPPRSCLTIVQSRTTASKSLWKAR